MILINVVIILIIRKKLKLDPSKLKFGVFILTQNRILNLQLERERTRNNNTKKAMAIMQHEVIGASPHFKLHFIMEH
jgi:hypothetical protein